MPSASDMLMPCLQELLEYTAAAAAVGGDDDSRSQCSDASSSGSSGRRLAAPAGPATAAAAVDDHLLCLDMSGSSAGEGWAGEGCRVQAYSAAAVGSRWDLAVDDSVPGYLLVTPTASAGDAGCAFAENAVGAATDAVWFEASSASYTATAAAAAGGGGAPTAVPAAPAGDVSSGLGGSSTAAYTTASEVAAAAASIAAVAEGLVGQWGSDVHIGSCSSNMGAAGVKVLAPAPVEGCMSREASHTAL